MHKVNLCKGCADEKGITDPAGFALANALMHTGSTTPTRRGPLEDSTACPECHFTQATFKKTGRFGCPHCYEVFGDNLHSLLKAMHKGTRHVGKIPARFQASHHRAREIDDLKARLDGAVSVEDFEEAARLRDLILKMETESEGRGVTPPLHSDG